jgi:hypothetical protein
MFRIRGSLHDFEVRAAWLTHALRCSSLLVRSAKMMFELFGSLRLFADQVD